MKSTGASESHCNNTLKTAIAFAHFIGPDQSFYDIRTKDKITDFLDTKISNNVTDPEKKWIRTWNDYLGDLKYLFRLLHNYKSDIHNASTTTQLESIHIGRLHQLHTEGKSI